MNFDSGRIYLDPEPAQTKRAALEVVMIGHCPGAADLHVLFANTAMLHDIEAAGYAEQLDLLQKSGQSSSALYNLPIPVRSLAEFAQLFPARKQTARYASRVAGDHLWLPIAVEDFFRYDGTRAYKKLWIINVNQELEQEAFFPDTEDNWLDISRENAFTRALGLPRVGLILLPDLERLQIPAQIEGIPHLRIANPVPEFLPCGTDTHDGIRERRNEDEMQRAREPGDFGDMLVKLLQTLSRYRPDMRLLLTLPYDRELHGEQPQASQAALEDIADLQFSQFSDALHRVQIIYPYLRDHRHNLMSASALLAGKIVETVATKGAWRSVAGVPLAGNYEPFPRLSQQQISEFRDLHRIGILRSRLNKTELDDERLMGGVFADSADHARSGEISRFIGWLYRELEAFGMDLLFNIDPRDPQPLIVLTDFFNRLHQLGALRGRTPEQAYTLRRILSENDTSTLIFQIDIAPSFPIDTIRLSLHQDRLEVTRV